MRTASDTSAGTSSEMIIKRLSIVAIIVLTVILSVDILPPSSRLDYGSLGAVGYLLLGLLILRRIRERFLAVRPLVFLPSTVFLGAYAVFFSVVGIDKALFDRDYSRVFDQDFAYFQVMLMAWTGLLAFDLGYGRKATRGTVFPQDQIDLFRSQLQKFRSLPFVLCALAGTGILAHLVRLPLGEGLWSILQNGLKWATYLAFLLWVLNRNVVSTIATLFLGAIFFRFQLAQVTQNRAQTLIPFVGLLAIWNIVGWIRTSTRQTVHMHSKLRDWVAFALLVFVVFVTFTVLSQVRFEVGEINSLEGYYRFSLGFFNGLESSMRVVSDVPSRVDYLNGKSLIAALYQFIPSALWSNKPVGMLAADAWLTSEVYGMDPRLVLTIPPIIAELYWNRGFWIVAIGMVGFGYLFKRFDSGLLKIDSAIWVMFYAGLAPLAVHLVRGPFGNWATRLVADLVPFLVILLAYRMSTRSEMRRLQSHTSMPGL